MERPTLNSSISVQNFKQFYWLKTELHSFCKKNNLPTSGSKEELTKRIYLFLSTGQILKPSTKNSNRTSSDQTLTLNSTIKLGYKNDERHRASFKTVIGDRFRFNVPFMNWMKQNSGKSYKEAVDVWLQIEKEKKAGKKTAIAPQFEYNQYTRDFFKANPNLSKEDAIMCWNYKKSISGHNRYEESDLAILTKK